MRTRAHRFPLLLLVAIALAAAGVAPGFAGAGLQRTAELLEMVICAGDGGTETVLIDADGARVDPDEACVRVHCPDCLRAKVFGPPPPYCASAPVGPATDVAPTAPFRLPPPPRSRFAEARGPPLHEV